MTEQVTMTREEFRGYVDAAFVNGGLATLASLRDVIDEWEARLRATHPMPETDVTAAPDEERA